MKKSKKILLTVGLAAVVLIVAGVILAAVFLDDIVKKGVETMGPLITQVPVTLTAVHISPATGSAKIEGLVVGNPEGYKSPSAISVGLAQIGVNPLSILSDKIVIRSIHIKAPEITFEGNPLGKNNLGEIMANVNAMAKSGGPPDTNTSTKPGAKPAKRIEVDDFLITGATAHVAMTGLVVREMTLTLPDIRLTNLGKGEAGLTPTDLTRAVMSAITSATIKAVASAAADPGKVTGSLTGTNLNKITKGIGGLLGK